MTFEQIIEESRKRIRGDEKYVHILEEPSGHFYQLWLKSHRVSPENTECQENDWLSMSKSGVN